MAFCIEKLVSIVSGDLKTDKLNPSVFKWKIGDTKEHFNNGISFSPFLRCYSFYTSLMEGFDRKLSIRRLDSLS